MRGSGAGSRAPRTGDRTVAGSTAPESVPGGWEAQEARSIAAAQMGIQTLVVDTTRIRTDFSIP